MQSDPPDLFDGTPSAPAAQPLRNRKRERFCQLLAGENYDNQTEAYHVAFEVEDRAACRAASSRLMRDPEVTARLAHLRSDAVSRLGVDRLYILAKRKYIAEHARSTADRLRALDDLERSLGLDEPVKIDVQHSGQVGVEHSGLAGILHIADPAAFARVLEAARANRSLPSPFTPPSANVS